MLLRDPRGEDVLNTYVLRKKLNQNLMIDIIIRQVIYEDTVKYKLIIIQITIIFKNPIALFLHALFCRNIII